MPRQNRVTPLGSIIASPARGTLMGNRGCLHNASGQITKTSARVAWIICELTFNGQTREVMTPGRYTELFFLDEATALAAGHRPCSTCQRPRLSEFQAVWQRVHPDIGSRTGDIDSRLTNERLASRGRDALYSARIDTLPNGAFVRLDEDGSVGIVWNGDIHRWSPEGYTQRYAVPGTTDVTVVTPLSVVGILSSGYVPRVHASLNASSGMQPLPVDVHPPVIGPAAQLEDGVVPQPATFRSDTLVATTAHEPVPAVHTIYTRHSGAVLYKMATTPRGRELAVYFAGILRVTGMDGGSVFPLKRFLSNFSGHLSAGRIESVAGGYRLTDVGREYFASRNSSQGITESEIQAAENSIRSGGEGWLMVE